LGIDPPDFVKSSFRRHGMSRSKLFGLLFAEMLAHLGEQKDARFMTPMKQRRCQATQSTTFANPTEMLKTRIFTCFVKSCATPTSAVDRSNGPIWGNAIAQCES
jgi:hypothetical protein